MAKPSPKKRSSRRKPASPAPALTPPAEREVDALAVALESESLEALYAAWLELRLQRAQAALARSRERDALDRKAEYLLAAVQAARTLPDAPARKPKPGKGARGAALVKVDPLGEFQAQAKAEVAAARKALDARERSEERAAERTEARVRKALLVRAEQHLAIHRPRLSLTVHPVGNTHVLIEVERPGDEDAVLLLHLLHERLPTRWGFFSDDAVEDLARGPARYYPDEGLADVWPVDAEAEDAIAFDAAPFVPVRGLIPWSIPDRAFPRFRLVHHGLMAQVEARREGEGYSHLLRREDGELLTGYLLRLKLGGRIELELKVG